MPEAHPLPDGVTDTRIVVLTPWFPTAANPFAGIFVADSVRALGLALDAPPPLVVHVDNQLPEDCGPAQWQRYADLHVLHIPVPTPAGTSRQQMGRNQRQALREHAADLIARAEVVHAHVGIPAGWAVLDLLPEQTRLVLTEHASYLHRELALSVGRQMYQEVIDRAEVVLAVSEIEARRIRSIFPDARERVIAFGNPVRTRALAVHERESEHLDRWLYVGNLLESKGVMRVLQAFAHWTAEHPERETSLTLVGRGMLEEELRQTASELGMADVVHFVGPVDPMALAPYLLAADVLVHLSGKETFGLALVEAAITGLPILTTTSGGPEETLVDAASEGLARFVPVQADTTAVVEAIKILEATWVKADRAAVRAGLLDRFGEAAFGARLLAILDGADPYQPLPDDAVTILALANSPRAYRRGLPLTLMTRGLGIRLMLATDQFREAVVSDPRVRVIDFNRMTRNAPWHFLTWLFIDRGPAWVMRRSTSAAVQVVRRVDREGSHAARLQRGGDRAVRIQRRAARTLRERVVMRLSSYVDPWYFGKRWAAQLAPLIREHNVRVLVMLDRTTQTIAWHLAQQFPDLVVMGVPTAADLRNVRE
ncbi:MAG: glycosyltransferase [Beutenbergiaceae bacterium]